MKQFPLFILIAICLTALAGTPAWSGETAPAAATGTAATPQSSGSARQPHGWYPPTPVPGPGYWGPPAHWAAPYYGYQAAPVTQPAPVHDRNATRAPGYRAVVPHPGYGARQVLPGANRAELDAMREELQQTRALLKDAGIALDQEYTGKQQTVAEQHTLGERLAAAMAEHDAAMETVSDLAAELQAARAREEGITGRLAKLQDFARTVSDERSELRKRIAAGEKKQAELKELVRDMAAERTGLRNDLAVRDKQLAALTAEVQAAAEAVVSVQEDSTTSRQQLDDIAAQHQACQAQLAMRTADLESELSDRTSTLASLADAVSARDRLQAELSTCNADLAQFHAAIDARQQADTPVTDSDADGVEDNDDLCPDTREGIEVGPTGCALDAPMALEGVSFHYDSHELTSDSHSILDRVAGILRQHPELRLEVAGHTDTQGDPDYNLWLSEQRAITVRDYLVKQGVNTDTLTARGYGPHQPIADNTTRAGLARNRRVELRRLP